MGGLFSCCRPPLSEVDERSALTSRLDAVTTAPEYRSIASNIEDFNTPPPAPIEQAPSSPPPPPPSPAPDSPQRPTTTRARSVTFCEQVSAADSEEVSVRQRSASDAEASNSAGLEGQATNASSEFGYSSSC